jgi:hypothetical protein
MARICSVCREPVAPVNMCICPDDDEPEDSRDGAEYGGEG